MGSPSTNPALPLYTEPDAHAALELFKPRAFNEGFEPILESRRRVQWAMSTGTVIERSTERVAPPSTHSRMRP